MFKYLFRYLLKLLLLFLYLKQNEIILKCYITIMTKDELGDISGGGQCTANGIWWWNQRIKKATNAERDAFMK